MTHDKCIRKKAGFAGHSEFEASRLDDEEIDALDRSIREFEGDLKAARLRVEKAWRATVICLRSATRR